MSLIFDTSATLGIALAQAAAPASVPPPIEQSSADCARPTYASDMLVCGDSDLRRLDSQLADFVRRAPLEATALIESDSAWFKRRSRCAFAADHSACLASAYEERLTVRVALVSSPETDSKIATRKGTQPLTGALLTSVSDAPILLIRDAATGKGIGVALVPAAKDAPWQPFASVTRKGKRVRITTLGGDSWQCRA
jgi:uncharacterized protein